MYRAIKTFVGKVSMKVNDTIEHLEKEVAEDLLQAGYIVEEKAKAKEVKIAPKVEEEKEEETIAPVVQKTKKAKSKK